MMASFKSLPDKYRGQISKDEGLYKCHQYFDQVNEYRQYDEERGSTPSQGRIHGAKDEDQAYKAQDDDMARDHIGKKTDDQGEGLRENTQYLHRHHDRLHAQWHGRIGDMPPIMPVGAGQDHNKSNNSQYGRESDIARHIGRSRHQADQVVDQDEEEDREQEGHILFILIPQVGLAYLIPDKGNNGFHRILKPGGSRCNAMSFCILTGHSTHQPHKQ